MPSVSNKMPLQLAGRCAHARLSLEEERVQLILVYVAAVMRAVDGIAAGVVCMCALSLPPPPPPSHYLSVQVDKHMLDLKKKSC